MKKREAKMNFVRHQCRLKEWESSIQERNIRRRRIYTKSSIRLFATFAVILLTTYVMNKLQKLHYDIMFYLRTNKTLEETNQLSQTQKELNIYLNPGPGKMATTTIQETLKSNVKTLSKDGYCTMDIGKGSKTHLGRLLKILPLDTVKTHPSWIEFLSFLDECFERQQNILLSDEGGIQPDVWNHLIKPAFSRWNFQILVGYRHYYEWAHSMYFQKFRGSRMIPPINKFVASNRGILNLYTDHYITYWQSLLGDDLHYMVYNMHQDTNIMKTLYCEVLTDTLNMCRKYSLEVSETRNKGYSLEYTRLVLAANKSGVIFIEYNQVDDTSRTLQSICENELNLSLTKFPRDCLTEEEKIGILNRTVTVEKSIVPEWFLSNGGHETIQHEFHSYAEKYLCSVDVDQVIIGVEFSQLWYRLREELYKLHVE